MNKVSRPSPSPTTSAQPGAPRPSRIKLALRRESMRELGRLELRGVAGGTISRQDEDTHGCSFGDDLR